MQDSNEEVSLEMQAVQQNEIEVQVQPTLEVNDHEITETPPSFLKIMKQHLLAAAVLSSSQLVVATCDFINDLMLSRVDTETLAASSLIGATNRALLILSIAPLVSISTQVSYVKNNRMDLINLGELFRQAQLMGLTSHLYSFFLFLFMKPILLGLNQPSDQVEIVKDFYNGFLCGFPAYSIYVASSLFIIGLEKHVHYFLITLIGQLIGLGFAYGLIFGKSGFQELGAKGSGYGQAIAAWIETCIFLGLFLIKKEFRPYHLFNRITRQEFTWLKKLWKEGSAILVVASNELALTFAQAIFAGLISKQALIATKVSQSYNSLLDTINIGLFSSISVLVSRAYGQDLSLVRRYGNVGIGLGFSFGLFCFIIVISQPRLFANLFIDESSDNSSSINQLSSSASFDPQETLSMASTMLMITMTQLVFESLKKATAGALFGIQQAVIPAGIDLLGSWIVALPLSYLLAFKADLGVNGLALGNAIWSILSAGFLLFWWGYNIQSVRLEKHRVKNNPTVVAAEVDQHNLSRSSSYSSFDVNTVEIKMENFVKQRAPSGSSTFFDFSPSINKENPPDQLQQQSDNLQF